MSSKVNHSNIAALCAITLSGLMLSSSLPSAGADEDVNSWIQESGSEKAPVANVKEFSESTIRKAVERPSANGDWVEEITPASNLPPKKIAQSMPLPVNANQAIKSVAAASSSGAPLLKGQVTYCVPRGTPLKLKLATVPMPEMKMDIKDEEGNLRPAQLGEIITAKITEDIYIDDNKVIPEGTIFHGKVSKISAPRHVGRAGHLELSFDRFTTPDGRKFAFKAEASNFHESTNQSKAKGLGVIAAHAAGGAAVGVLVAYKLFGPQNTVAMHGYNIAGGAAIGAAGGIAWALWRRGPQAVLEPGDEFAMSIDTDLLIPAATAPTVKASPVSLPGFEMEVLSKKTIKDGFGGHMLRLESVITNNTHKKLSSLDLFIMDDLGNRYPVAPDIDEDAQELFYIQPLSQTRIVCTFAVEYPKLKHKLIWLDHSSREIVFEQKI